MRSLFRGLFVLSCVFLLKDIRENGWKQYVDAGVSAVLLIASLDDGRE